MTDAADTVFHPEFTLTATAALLGNYTYYLDILDAFRKTLELFPTPTRNAKLHQLLKTQPPWE